jgi:hypothetical protein
MVEHRQTGRSSRFGRYSMIFEALQDQQEQIRAACAEQCERAASVRREAADLRAQIRPASSSPTGRPARRSADGQRSARRTR